MNQADKYDKSKRIASNTIVLFVRMLILTIVNLYAVRLAFNGLGEENYGIFNTVAGVVTAASVFSGVVALSIQRFYSYAMGQNDSQKLQDIFGASMDIMIVLTVILLLLLESIGLWFFYTQLVIPADRMNAAWWIYQCSILILACSMLQIPYTAAIFSHEDMGVYTTISTVECLLKFLTAYSLTWSGTDHLILYASGLSVTAIIIAVMYATVGHHRYMECHYKKTKGKALYRELLSFSAWTLFGSLASMGMIQGNTILLNIYFGPIIVAAFSIALQINNAFNTLSNSMVLAFRPPMIKAYAEQQNDYLNQLFSVSNKFIYYTLLAIAIPIILNMDTILSLWLGHTTPDIILFSRAIIVYIVCLAMHHPITIVMQASGHIKEYHLPVESITLMCFPLTWLFFHFDLPAYSVFLSMIAICLIAHIVRLYCLKRFYDGFSIKEYFVSFVVPAIIILFINSIIAVAMKSQIENTLWSFVLSVLSIPSFVFLSTYLFGISPKERLLLSSMTKNIINQRICHK